MSPTLAALVTQASSIQRMGADNVRRANAFLISSLGSGIYGQTPSLASPLSPSASLAQTVAAAFQGLTEEQYFDILTYTIAVSANSHLVPGPISSIPTDGFALNNLVNTYWGNPNGIVDAQQVDALIKFGTLLQAGANLSVL